MAAGFNEKILTLRVTINLVCLEAMLSSLHSFLLISLIQPLNVVESDNQKLLQAACLKLRIGHYSLCMYTDY